MTKRQALVAACDLIRAFLPKAKAEEYVNALSVDERPSLRRSPKALERMSACEIRRLVHTPFGDTHEILAYGESWDDAVAELRQRYRSDRVAYNGATPWLWSLIECAAAGTLDPAAARQFLAWVDHEDGVP